MTYSIAEAAKMAGVAPSTLRYYDKEGLLPQVKRLEGGARTFTEQDMEWLHTIGYLKQAGLTIKDIRRYTELAQQGDATIAARRDLIFERREALKAELASMERTLDFITYKCWYYDEAVKRGSERAVKQLADREVPAAMLALRQACLNAATNESSDA